MLEALETESLKNMEIDIVIPEELEKGTSKVLSWLELSNYANVIIHFDLDVLDMREFRAILPGNPEKYNEMLEFVPKASSIETIIKVIQDVSNKYNVVGLGITEHFPWDAYLLQNMLGRLPLIGDERNKTKAEFNWPF